MVKTELERPTCDSQTEVCLYYSNSVCVCKRVKCLSLTRSTLKYHCVVCVCVGYPRGRFNNLSNAGGSNHTLQGLPRQNNVLSSPSSLLHSGSLQQVDSLQTPLSQSHMYQHQTSTSDRDLSYQQSTPPSSEQCNEYHVHHTSEVKLTPLPESDYHYTSNDAAQKSTKAQMSSKEQRIATSSTHQISGKQKHRRSDSKVLANCESGKLSVRKSTGTYIM